MCCASCVKDHIGFGGGAYDSGRCEVCCVVVNFVVYIFTFVIAILRFPSSSVICVLVCAVVGTLVVTIVVVTVVVLTIVVVTIVVVTIVVVTIVVVTIVVVTIATVAIVILTVVVIVTVVVAVVVAVVVVVPILFVLIADEHVGASIAHVFPCCCVDVSWFWAIASETGVIGICVAPM